MDPRTITRPPDSVRAIAAAGGLVLIVALTPNGCTVRLPHSGDNPVFELKGLHKSVPCEGCHGQFEGKPEPQSRSCVDCHANDLPAANHYPGQECFPCHTEDGWAVGVYDSSDTADTPPDTDTDTGLTVDTGWVHDFVPATQLCWDCHGEGKEDPERPAGHYYNVNLRYSWDCGPCHTLVSWTDNTLVHPVRTPHGTYSRSSPTSPPDWIVACFPCHTDAYDFTKFQCGECHLENDPTFFPHKNLTAPSPEVDATCLDCHDEGDRIEF